MTLLTGLLLAAFLAAPQTTEATGVANLNPPVVPVADAEVDGAAPGDGREDLTRRRNPDDVVCETRPVTGSRFNQRRCRTRAHAQTAAAEARRFLGEVTRSGPSTDASLSSGPVPIGP